jgi:hypothetical protein
MIVAADTTYISEILIPFARTIKVLIQSQRNKLASGSNEKSRQIEVILAQAERHPSTFLQYLDALRVSRLLSILIIFLSFI